MTSLTKGHGSHQPVPDGERCRRRTRLEIEFGEDVTNVVFDRALAHREKVPNGAVGVSLDKQAQDLQLAGGETIAQRLWSAMSMAEWCGPSLPTRPPRRVRRPRTDAFRPSQAGAKAGSSSFIRARAAAPSSVRRYPELSGSVAAAPSKRAACSMHPAFSATSASSINATWVPPSPCSPASTTRASLSSSVALSSWPLLAEHLPEGDQCHGKHEGIVG